MPSSREKPNKAKIARRVIEVLDFFDDENREASVMDIVRRYGRPQSSTSELLASLVELGLLHKDPHSRTYSLTPRAALLGWSGQTGIVRDGSLVRITDRLVAQTGFPVAVFAMTGLNVQIVSWRTGPRTAVTNTRGLFGGVQFPMSTSAAGWLLLSTVPQPRRDGMVRRLNAEATEERKFVVSVMTNNLQACQERGWVEGHAGCNTNAKLVARLLPVGEGERPLAVGLVHGVEDQVDAASLLASLDEAIEHCLGQRTPDDGNVKQYASAA